MMSEKRQKKKIVKTPSCEPDIQIQDESDLEGRVPGSNKQLLDDEVHKVLGEDLESPPPPYSPTEYGLTLTVGDNSPRPKKEVGDQDPAGQYHSGPGGQQQAAVDAVPRPESLPILRLCWHRRARPKLSAALET